MEAQARSKPVQHLAEKDIANAWASSFSTLECISQFINCLSEFSAGVAVAVLMPPLSLVQERLNGTAATCIINSWRCR